MFRANVTSRTANTNSDVVSEICVFVGICVAVAYFSTQRADSPPVPSPEYQSYELYQSPDPLYQYQPDPAPTSMPFIPPGCWTPPEAITLSIDPNYQSPWRGGYFPSLNHPQPSNEYFLSGTIFPHP